MVNGELKKILRKARMKAVGVLLFYAVFMHILYVLNDDKAQWQVFTISFVTAMLIYFGVVVFVESVVKDLASKINLN